LKPEPFDRTSAMMITVVLAIVAVYVTLAAHDKADVNDQLRIERGRRKDAEELAEKRRLEMDNALEEIHGLRGDESTQT
jgi:hypothetical protein